MLLMQLLTLDVLKTNLKTFIELLHQQSIHKLYGVTDGKAVGTYVELLLKSFLRDRFEFEQGNAASGIDFPSLNVDLKVTSIRQPQSSSPFRSARQKIYGLGYHLFVLVYDKQDDKQTETSHLQIKSALFIHKERTGDYQLTRGILDLLNRDANKDDLIAFFEDRQLPVDETGREMLAEEVLVTPPLQGYLTISNAMQWRLQYNRALTISASGGADGLEALL
jgi:restriction system protein